MNSAARTVLIVDDDRQILGLVEKMLRPQGVIVLSANRPSEALRICEERVVDVLISDVMMPEMDGARLADRFLKLRPEARVLLISGQAKPPSVSKLPNVRFLRKPFFPSVLVQELRELLGVGEPEVRREEEPEDRT
jgi:CheY-like chemotaxis protein